MANVVSKLLLRMQLVQSSNVVFVNNSLELLGSYVGQTPMKVDAKVQEAAGGVLFIDEAYSIVKEGGGREGSGASFGKEAIDTLMKHMDPPSCVMIFAGYSKEMEDFLTVNSGLARRIPYRYTFHAYTQPQLMQIFLVMCKAKGETLGEGVEDEVITDLGMALSHAASSPALSTSLLRVVLLCAVPPAAEWCGRRLAEFAECGSHFQLAEFRSDGARRSHRPQRGGATAQPRVHTRHAGPRASTASTGQDEAQQQQPPAAAKCTTPQRGRHTARIWHIDDAAVLCLVTVEAPLDRTHACARSTASPSRITVSRTIVISPH